MGAGGADGPASLLLPVIGYQPSTAISLAQLFSQVQQSVWLTFQPHSIISLTELLA
jgi:hypothetical protein